METDVQSFNLRSAALTLALLTACGGGADADHAYAPPTLPPSPERAQEPATPFVSPSAASAMASNADAGPWGAIGAAGSSPLTLIVPVANAENVIRTQIHPGAKRCYQEALQLDSHQAGRVAYLLDVAPDGTVASSTVVRNTGLSEDLANCIADVTRRAKFDPPGPKGARISVPFNFKKAE